MAGDLFIKVIIENHQKFERKGADLYFTQKITLYEALTGTLFQVEHLDGTKLSITTPPGDVLSPGMIKQVAKKGMPFYRDSMSFGNLYITFDVVFPKKNELKNPEKLSEVSIPIKYSVLMSYIDPSSTQNYRQY